MPTGSFENFEVESEFCQPDPEALKLLTGDLSTDKCPTYSVEIYTPIKRTFWQWLLRKPKRYRTHYIPRMRFEES